MSNVRSHVTVTALRIAELVEYELQAVTDRRVVDHIRDLLVRPEPVMRDWDYGAEGEAYACWAVLNHPRSNTSIAYCESGFGPRRPWGLVFLHDPDSMSIGQDSGWFDSFLHAYFESSAPTDLPIWRVFERKSGPSPGLALTAESDYESTSREVERRQALNPSGRYICWQSVHGLET
jgi:hypothetical protein